MMKIFEQMQSNGYTVNENFLTDERLEKKFNGKL